MEATLHYDSRLNGKFVTEGLKRSSTKLNFKYWSEMSPCRAINLLLSLT